MTIKLSPFAEQDLDDTLEFYNGQMEGLGFEFLHEAKLIFEQVQENPCQFPIAHKKMRKAKINRFPFNIFFVDELLTSFIIGIFHSSRNPNIIKKRYGKK